MNTNTNRVMGIAETYAAEISYWKRALETAYETNAAHKIVYAKEKLFDLAEKYNDHKNEIVKCEIIIATDRNGKKYNLKKSNNELVREGDVVPDFNGDMFFIQNAYAPDGSSTGRVCGYNKNNVYGEFYPHCFNLEWIDA